MVFSNQVSFVEVLQNLRTHGLCSDIDLSPIDCIDSDKDKLRSLFYKIVSIFLKEASKIGVTRSLPVLLGNGQSVDLFKLHSVVREKGGYEIVTKRGLWVIVTEEIGLNTEIGSAVKLVYAKYLYALDKWLHKILAKEGNLSLSPVDLGLESNHPCNSHHCNTEHVVLPEKSIKKRVFLNHPKKLPLRNVDEAADAVSSHSSRLKRKRESLLRMVDWLKTIAVNPYDLFMNGKLNNRNAFFMQAIQTRRTLCRRRGCSSLEKELLQSDGLSCSERLSSQHKIQLAVSLTGSVIIDNESIAPDDDPDYDFVTVRLGSFFQADVPRWTEVTSKIASKDAADSKWLGTRIWSPEHDHSLLKTDIIGKGRTDACGCQYPASAGCVKFHIEEKKMKLKKELGPAYYTWKFNLMGEKISLSWTKEEEEKFKNIVRQNPPSQGLSFYNKLYMSFPCKNRNALVSYYFNVFVLRRRRYQNHVSPNNVDSDDDETPFGCIGDDFNNGSLTYTSEPLTFCAENRQPSCLDELGFMD